MNLTAARFLSFLLNPLLVIVVVPFFLIYKSTGDPFSAINWTIYTLFFLLAMGLFIIYMVRKGRFTDTDVSKREQRPVLFLAGTILAVIYLAGLFLFQAPSILYVITCGIIIGIIVASIINRWIKASMHVATIAALFSALAISYGGYHYLFLLLIPVVAYIRVRAKRHTIPETIVGAIFGMSLSIMMHLMLTSFLD